MKTPTSSPTRHSLTKRGVALLVLSFSHFLLLTVGAQTFTQRIQKPVAGQGTITIHQDSAIDQLVNAAPLGPAANPTAPAAGKQPQPSAQPATTGTTASHEQNDTVDTRKKVMRNGYKVSGYRVQAFAGGGSRKDREQAEQIGRSIKAQFANVPVYVHFYAPRWICRVGNYRTYEEAHQMLLSLRKAGYQQATIVKGKITVQY